MNVLVTSLLTISLLVVAPGCRQGNRCEATYIDADNKLQTVSLATLTEDEAAPSQNIKS